MPSGKIEPSDSDLSKSESRFVLLATVCGVIVVFGLVIEIVASLCLLGWSWRLFWTALLPDTFITLGVGGELLFSALAKGKSDELGRRSAETAANANERAAKLELERVKMLKLMAHRRLLGEQQEQMAEALKQWALLPKTDKKQSVAVFATNPPDFECVQFANDVARVFELAGWDVNRYPVTHGMSIAVQGVGVLSSSNPRGTGVALSIVQVFWGHGVFTHLIFPPRKGCEEQGMPPEEIAANPACSQVSVFVGIKPWLPPGHPRNP